MIALAAVAFDNGFKLVIVFTTNYLELVKQTKGRFQAVDGRKIFDSTRSEDWIAEAEHFARQLSRSGVVIVCAKDPTHTNHLVHLLESRGPPVIQPLCSTTRQIRQHQTPQWLLERVHEMQRHQVMEPRRARRQKHRREAAQFFDQLS